ncbi:MAG: SufD family Fe-S cluster assembly protein [Clostridia bacterium]|nr:SufD family Fe-S cluster assembly protein [Clostridia bacterium]
MDIIEKNLLKEIADLHEIPTGAYNIRKNGESAGRSSTEHIIITNKEDVPGIDIRILPNTKNESVHIPVILTQTGLNDTVYNDFFIGENCDVTIVAGCGIHNSGCDTAKHDGIHTFHVGENSVVRYVEKHYGQGEGEGKNVMNPQTVIILEKGATMELETTQIGGVDSTERKTTATVADEATLIIREKLLTEGNQSAVTDFTVDLNGENSSTNIISRSVAKNHSHQEFISRINGNNLCHGHTECDAIIMDQATVLAVPEVSANHINASLIHEAAIGKIAGEQLMKLMTLGLTEAQAEEQIIAGFLK